MKKMLLLSLLVLTSSSSLFAAEQCIRPGFNLGVNLPGISFGIGGGSARPGMGGGRWNNGANGGGRYHHGGGAVTVYSAIYGQNCGRPMNVIAHVQDACNAQMGGSGCNYYVNHFEIGDPAYGCAKDFQVLYSCGGGPVRQAYVPAEASGRYAQLMCW